MALERLSSALSNRIAQNRSFANRTRFERRATVGRLLEEQFAKRDAEKAQKEAESAKRKAGLIKAGIVVAGAATGGVAAAAAGGLSVAAGAAIGGSLAAPIGDIGASFVKGSGGTGGFDVNGLISAFDRVDDSQRKAAADAKLAQGDTSAEVPETFGDADAALLGIPPVTPGADTSLTGSLPKASLPTPPNVPTPQIPEGSAFSTNEVEFNKVVSGEVQ